MTPLESVVCQDGVAAIALEDTMLSMWRSPASPERVRWLNDRVEAWLSSTTGPVLYCQLLLPTASPPGRQALAEALVGYRLLEPRARRLIIVPLGDAFWRGMVRGVVRAGLAASRRSTTIRVAKDERNAIDLLTEVASEGSPDRTSLERAVGALRVALES